MTENDLRVSQFFEPLMNVIGYVGFFSVLSLS